MPNWTLLILCAFLVGVQYGEWYGIAFIPAHFLLKLIRSFRAYRRDR